MKKGSNKQIVSFSKKGLKAFDKKKVPLVKMVYASLFLSLANLGLVILFQNHLPPELPLFYGLAKGSEQLGSSLQLTIPGIIALSITIVNFILALFINNNFLRQMLILSAFAVSVFSLITVIKIALLVGSI